MFGIGPQELVIIGLLALLIFGPGKLPEIARDLGGFVRKAQRSMDEFKSEFAPPEARWSGEAAKHEEETKVVSSHAPTGQERRARQANDDGDRSVTR